MSPEIARAVAGLLGAAAALLWLMCMYLVARSGFSTDPAIDPHGFALMFGTIVGVIAGLLFAVVLPAAFPAARRRAVARVCMATFVVATALVYVGLALR